MRRSLSPSPYEAAVSMKVDRAIEEGADGGERLLLAHGVAERLAHVAERRTAHTDRRHHESRAAQWPLR